MFDKWQREYDLIDKGVFYKKSNPLVGVKPWFLDLNLNRRSIRIINRIRSNHGLCGAYLNRIGRANTNVCTECGTLDDLEHILMECKKYSSYRVKLFSSLQKKIKSPFNYINIIQEVRSTSEELTEFINEGCIKV